MQQHPDPDKELQDILSNLDHESGPAEQERRRAVRHTYRVDEGLEIKVKHPSGSAATHHMRPRNLSATGISFLHTGYLHVNTSCTIHLRLLDGEKAAVCGHVVRCDHIRGVVHDVGLRFSEPIPVVDFVTLPSTDDANGSK